MGTSSSLERYKGLIIVVVLLLVVTAVVVVVWQNKPTTPPPAPMSGQSFYSIDDGKTFFSDLSAKVPPFDHTGQSAVRAYVFTCDGGKTKFVGYLERYTEEGKKQLEAALVKKEVGPMPTLIAATSAGAEIKRPGDAEWVSRNDVEKIIPITEVKCPHEGAHAVEPVQP